MHLVTFCDGVLWSWKVHALLDNLVDDGLKLLLHLIQWFRKGNLCAIDAQLQSDEIVFQWSVCIVLTLDDLIWPGIFS